MTGLSTLSALLTRDVYARLFVCDKSDIHYMRVGQWLTPLIIGGSFLYVPFLKGGMLLFYIDLTSTFVIPLLTLFLMGAFSIMTNTFAAYAFSMLITAGTMVFVSLFLGWEPRGHLLHEEQTPWLRSGQLALQQLDTEPHRTKSAMPWLPALLAAVAVAIGGGLSFWFFW